MPTINLETKKKLIKKTQSRSAKQILLIDDKKDSILSAAAIPRRFALVCAFDRVLSLCLPLSLNEIPCPLKPD